jgi:hypothetical protein
MQPTQKTARLISGVIGGNSMKQKRIDAWKRIRSIGKGRFIFDTICMFYFIVSIITTLIDLWPDGKFINLGSFLTKVFILSVGGLIIALIAWNNNEKEFKKANTIESKPV